MSPRVATQFGMTTAMWWVGKNIYSYPPIGSPSGGAHVISGDLNQFLKVVKTGKLLSP